LTELNDGESEGLRGGDIIGLKQKLRTNLTQNFNLLDLDLNFLSSSFEDVWYRL